MFEMHRQRSITFVTIFSQPSLLLSAMRMACSANGTRSAHLGKYARAQAQYDLARQGQATRLPTVLRAMLAAADLRLSKTETGLPTAKQVCKFLTFVSKKKPRNSFLFANVDNRNKTSKQDFFGSLVFFTVFPRLCNLPFHLPFRRGKASHDFPPVFPWFCWDFACFRGFFPWSWRFIFPDFGWFWVTLAVFFVSGWFFCRAFRHVSLFLILRFRCFVGFGVFLARENSRENPRENHWFWLIFSLADFSLIWFFFGRFCCFSWDFSVIWAIFPKLSLILLFFLKVWEDFPWSWRFFPGHLADFGWFWLGFLRLIFFSRFFPDFVADLAVFPWAVLLVGGFVVLLVLGFLNKILGKSSMFSPFRLFFGRFRCFFVGSPLRKILSFWLQILHFFGSSRPIHAPAILGVLQVFWLFFLAVFLGLARFGYACWLAWPFLFGLFQEPFSGRFFGFFSWMCLSRLKAAT